MIAGALGACALLLTWSGAAGAAWPGKNGMIAFTRNGNIWVMQPNGSHQRRIAKEGIEPAWSPDGRHIAFSRLGAIWVMRPDGTHQVQITGTDEEANAPAWSPNGRYVLFQAPGHGDGYGIFKRRATRPFGPIIAVVSPQPFQDALEPAYAANGVFSYQLDEDNTSFGNCCDIRVVSGGTDRDLRFCFCFGRVDWGPQSRVVAYGDAYYDPNIDDFTKSRITVVRADGTHLRVITHPGDDLFDEHPSWAPGGTWLVYDEMQNGFSVSNGIFKIRGDGTGRVRIAGNATDPSWQPLP
jgi:Tol biopolymer transport system component